MTVIRGFPVAIRRPCADIITVFHGLPCLRLNFSSNIQGIGFVYHIFRGSISLHGGCGVRRVKLVRDGNKKENYERKNTVQYSSRYQWNCAGSLERSLTITRVDVARFQYPKASAGNRDGGSLNLSGRCRCNVIDYKIRFNPLDNHSTPAFDFPQNSPVSCYPPQKAGYTVPHTYKDGTCIGASLFPTFSCHLAHLPFCGLFTICSASAMAFLYSS